ncbi:MAG TPA: PfkB family carbohydrate kinase, partial [Candidatus Limnocylindrales bacterium]|nr:PfkB family carbohydrate kinase [Candidatus Limnocylindrales bacterium]
NIEVLSISPLLDSLQNSPGGIGANVAYNLALLGERPVLLCSVGTDAKDYVQRLGEAGIDTSQVHVSELATASFNVISDSDGNQVGGFYPGAMSDSGSLSFEPWKGQNVMAMISAHDPVAMNHQVAECQSYGLPLIYDPGQQVTHPATDLTAGIAAATLLFVNEYELGILCEKVVISSDDLKAKLPIVITTLGKNGSVIEGRQAPEPLQIAIAKPAQVVDPTGAGDAYRAGFLYGYLRQWDLRKCGQLGAVIASFIVEQQGTQCQFSRQDVVTRYRDNFNEEIEL